MLTSEEQVFTPEPINTNNPGEGLIEAKPYELIYASTGKRFCNYLVDLICFFILIFCWAIIASIVSAETLVEFEEILTNPILEQLISMLLFALFMSLIEMIFRGKSIGKFITGTKAVNEHDGSDISFNTAFARGFSRLIPFEALSALGTPCIPWHDKWTNTLVIDEKLTKEANKY